MNVLQQIGVQKDQICRLSDFPDTPLVGCSVVMGRRSFVLSRSTGNTVAGMLTVCPCHSIPSLFSIKRGIGVLWPLVVSEGNVTSVNRTPDCLNLYQFSDVVAQAVESDRKVNTLLALNQHREWNQSYDSCDESPWIVKMVQHEQSAVDDGCPESEVGQPRQ
jgi:hypothetical protein